MDSLKTFLLAGLGACLIVVGSLTVFASGSGEEDPTPTPPSVGRRAVMGGDATADTTVEACAVGWFFNVPQPATCPDAAPTASELVLQRFEYGYMVWAQADDRIYVMYHTAPMPRWQADPDPYVAGMDERDFSWDEPQPPQTSQPRLGFGALWREDDDLRERIGWAVQSWEFVYDGQMQTAEDGTVYFSEPRGGVFELSPQTEDWKLFSPQS